MCAFAGSRVRQLCRNYSLRCAVFAFDPTSFTRSSQRNALPCGSISVPGPSPIASNLNPRTRLGRAVVRYHQKTSRPRTQPTPTIDRLSRPRRRFTASRALADLRARARSQPEDYPHNGLLRLLREEEQKVGRRRATGAPRRERIPRPGEAAIRKGATCDTFPQHRRVRPWPSRMEAAADRNADIWHGRALAAQRSRPRRPKSRTPRWGRRRSRSGQGAGTQSGGGPAQGREGGARAIGFPPVDVTIAHGRVSLTGTICDVWSHYYSPRWGPRGGPLAAMAQIWHWASWDGSRAGVLWCRDVRQPLGFLRSLALVLWERIVSSTGKTLRFFLPWRIVPPCSASGPCIASRIRTSRLGRAGCSRGGG